MKKPGKAPCKDCELPRFIKIKFSKKVRKCHSICRLYQEWSKNNTEYNKSWREVKHMSKFLDK
jgi:hypothetical protein